MPMSAPQKPYSPRWRETIWKTATRSDSTASALQFMVGQIKTSDLRNRLILWRKMHNYALLEWAGSGQTRCGGAKSRRTSSAVLGGS